MASPLETLSGLRLDSPSVDARRPPRARYAQVAGSSRRTVRPPPGVGLSFGDRTFALSVSTLWSA